MSVAANICLNTYASSCVYPYVSGYAPSGAFETRHAGSVVSAALPQPSRPAILAALAIAVVVLVAFLLVRRAVLRRGGWRRSWRRLRSEASLTVQAWAEPLRALSRYRQGVSALAARLADPASQTLAQRALDAAASVLADAPGAYPYAVRMGPDAVTVEVAGRRLPVPSAPWRAESAAPGRWRIGYGDLRDVPAETWPGTGREQRRLVAVGVHDEASVFLDLAASPGLVTVEGDGPAGRGLLQALAAQLDGPGAGVNAMVTVVRGVHPQHHGPELDEVLDALERSGADRTVVVCVGPAREQAGRLVALAEAETALCLVHGRAAGPRWTLRVDHRSHLTAPELGIRADCGPLPRSVARALKSARHARGSEVSSSVGDTQPIPIVGQSAPRAPGTMPAGPTAYPASGDTQPDMPRPNPAPNAAPAPGPHGYGEHAGNRQPAPARPLPDAPAGDAASLPVPPTEPGPAMPERVGRSARAASARPEGGG